ncbi:hypothetical protein AB4120_04730 [Cupriavidus sp. 2KB_3]|uniref:hypothetical protein n=1 Tax=Cupriavidus sp. 2KB_3 TaxID=3232980 RepID=UPI003F8FFBD4
MTMDKEKKQQKLQEVFQQRLGVFNSADLWGLETLKHIAIGGSAGAAACFAIRAGTDPVAAKASWLPAILFAGGTISAVAAMAAGYFQREAVLEIHLEAEEILKDESTDTSRYLRLNCVSRNLAPLVTSLAWVGLGFDVAGGFYLFRSL